MAHALLCSAGLGLLAFFPPAQGQILLVPLLSSGRGELIRFAIDHDARLVARGPLPGSMIVEGQRAALGKAIFTHGWLPLASRAKGCGAA